MPAQLSCYVEFDADLYPNLSFQAIGYGSLNNQLSSNQEFTSLTVVTRLRLSEAWMEYRQQNR